MNKSFKSLVKFFSIFCIVVFGIFTLINIAFENLLFPGPTYSKDDLIENFENRKSAIIEVKDYLSSILPKGADVDIEFDDDEIAIFHLKKNGIYSQNWHLTSNSQKIDSLLTELGWTKKELYTLRSKLNNANCISASSGNPVTIGWQRSGMGMYFYKVFDQKLTDSLIQKYNDGCIYIYYKDNIVLEYGGGAVGPQCFPGFERKNIE